MNEKYAHLTLLGISGDIIDAIEEFNDMRTFEKENIYDFYGSACEAWGYEDPYEDIVA